MPKPGTVFQLIVGGGNHFWVIISKPKAGLVLAVNITDASHCPDSPCHLATGDHEVIVKPSVVYYRKAREFSVEAIDRELKAGKSVRQLRDCSESLLQRIIDGARKADDLTIRFLQYLDS